MESIRPWRLCVVYCIQCAYERHLFTTGMGLFYPSGYNFNKNTTHERLHAICRIFSRGLKNPTEELTIESRNNGHHRLEKACLCSVRVHPRHPCRALIGNNDRDRTRLSFFNVLAGVAGRGGAERGGAWRQLLYYSWNAATRRNPWPHGRQSGRGAIRVYKEQGLEGLGKGGKQGQ